MKKANVISLAMRALGDTLFLVLVALVAALGVSRRTWRSVQ